MSLEEAIYAVDDLPRRAVPCPEWEQALAGQKLYVRLMPSAERDALEAESVALEDGQPGTKLNNFRARVLVRCVVDEAGQLVFHDAAKLGRKSSVVTDRLYDAAAELNKLRKSDQEALVKNSAAAPSGASGSSSPTATEDPSASCNASLAA